MTKQEFEKITGVPVPTELFERIDFVYTFHPAISEVTGKQQIADLYIQFGSRLIEDMYPTACKAKALEEDIRKKSLELDALRDTLTRLQKGL